MSEPQPPSNVGLVSQDGKWRWDGTGWQPIEPIALASAPTPVVASPATSVPATKRSRGWISYLAVGVAGLIVGGVCGLASASANNSSNNSGSSSTPAAQSSAVSDHSLALSYAAVVSDHTTPLEDALNTVGSSCGSGDMSACRSAITSVQGQDQSFLSDLGKLTVPACLSPVNEELVTAIELELDGDSQAIAGIDANDASQITAAAGLINLGTTHLNKATALLKNNPCG